MTDSQNRWASVSVILTTTVLSLSSVPVTPAYGQAEPTDTHPVTKGNVAALLDKSQLADCELHVVGIYGPQESGTDDRVYVEVKPTDKPIVVALTAYNKTEWHLKIDPKASVRQIIIAGYFEQNLAEPTPDVPIIWQTYFPTADRKQRDYFWAHDWHTKEGKDLRKKLNDMTGLDITTFQAEYHGSLFVIDGKRGNITGLDDETPVSPTAIAGSPEEVDDYVELIEGYVNKLNEATDAGRVDEAEKLKDIIRYMLLAIRIQREQTNSQLTELRQTLKDLNVNGDSRMIERVQAEIRTAEDILATETKYAGFLLPLKSANAPAAIGFDHMVQKWAPRSSAEEYLRLELVKSRVEEATMAAEYGSDHPKLIQVRQRLEILLSQRDELTETTKVEAENAANTVQIGKTPSNAEAELQRSAERSRLESKRRLSDAELKRAEGAAGMAAANYRDEAAKKRPVPANLKRLKETLRREVTRALGFQTAVQQHRMQLAEMDLQEVKVRQQRRAALAATIIERRVEELLSGEDLSWPQTSTPDTTLQQQYTFGTPEKLLEYIGKCGRNRDYDNYVGPMTDEAVWGFAGMLLESATMMNTFSPLAAVAENAPDAAAVIEISTVLARSIRPDPPAAATAAHQQLAESMLARALALGKKIPVASPELVIRRLQTAAHVLKNPRLFVAEMLKAMEALNGNPVALAGGKSPRWNIIVDGDRAAATDTSNMSDDNPPQQIELQRIDGGWRISKLFSDDTLSLFAAGPQVTPVSVPPTN